MTLSPQSSPLFERTLFLAVLRGTRAHLFEEKVESRPQTLCGRIFSTWGERMPGVKVSICPTCLAKARIWLGRNFYGEIE